MTAKLILFSLFVLLFFKSYHCEFKFGGNGFHYPSRYEWHKYKLSSIVQLQFYVYYSHGTELYRAREGCTGFLVEGRGGIFYAATAQHLFKGSFDQLKPNHDQRVLGEIAVRFNTSNNSMIPIPDLPMFLLKIDEAIGDDNNVILVPEYLPLFYANSTDKYLFDFALVKLGTKKDILTKLNMSIDPSNIISAILSSEDLPQLGDRIVAYGFGTQETDPNMGHLGGSENMKTEVCPPGKTDNFTDKNKIFCFTSNNVQCKGGDSGSPMFCPHRARKRKHHCGNGVDPNRIKVCGIHVCRNTWTFRNGTVIPLEPEGGGIKISKMCSWLKAKIGSNHNNAFGCN